MQVGEEQAVFLRYGEIPDIVTQLLRQAIQPMSAAEITQAALRAKGIEHPTAHQTRLFKARVARFLSRMKKKGKFAGVRYNGGIMLWYLKSRSPLITGDIHYGRTCDELCRLFPADALCDSKSAAALLTQCLSGPIDFYHRYIHSGHARGATTKLVFDAFDDSHGRLVRRRVLALPEGSRTAYKVVGSRGSPPIHQTRALRLGTADLPPAAQSAPALPRPTIRA